MVISQDLIGQPACLFELLHLLTRGCVLQSYLASELLRCHSSSSLQASLHVHRFFAVISSCQDLKSSKSCLQNCV